MYNDDHHRYKKRKKTNSMRKSNEQKIANYRALNI